MLNVKELFDLFALSITIGFMVGCVGFIYTVVLTRPGEIFSGLYRRLNERFNKIDECTWRKHDHPLFKILIGCEKCNSGQLALWTYPLFIGIRNYEPLHIMYHLFAISTAILFSIILNSIYQKWLRN